MTSDASTPTWSNVRVTLRALRTSLTRVAKPALTRLVWLIRGIGVANPSIPTDVHTILFVCLGNICRSPFAARLAERRFAECGRTDIQCLSAGLRPSQACGAPAEACDASVAYGVSLVGHTPQLLTRDLLEASDVVVVMEAAQLFQLQTTYADLKDRLFLLPLLDPVPTNSHERLNIRDPFGQTAGVYEQCYARIDRAVRRLVTAVSSAGRPPVAV